MDQDLEFLFTRLEEEMLHVAEKNIDPLTWTVRPVSYTVLVYFQVSIGLFCVGLWTSNNILQDPRVRS